MQTVRVLFSVFWLRMPGKQTTAFVVQKAVLFRKVVYVMGDAVQVESSQVGA